MKIEFESSYFKNFKCLGGSCPFTCCKGWKILVDDETYSKYLKLHDEYSKFVLNNISKSKKLIYLDRNYCPMLNSNGLCNIQIKYGEEYISKLCRTFPRKHKEFEHLIFHDLYLSCPETVRIICDKKSFCYIFKDKSTDFLNNFFKFFNNKKIYQTNYAFYKILSSLEEEKNITKKLKNFSKDNLKNILKDFKTNQTDYDLIFEYLLFCEKKLNSMEFSNEEAVFLNKSISIQNISLTNFIKAYKLVNRILKKLNQKNLQKHLFTNAFVSYQKRASDVYLFAILVLRLFIFKKIYTEGVISKQDVYKIITCLSRALEHSNALNEFDRSSNFFNTENVLKFLSNKY